MSNSNTKHSFSCCHFIVYHWPCLVSYVKLYNWYVIHFSVMLVHNGMIIVMKKIGIISFHFCCLFLFLDPKVNNFDSTHGCPLSSQNDILDDPIPCRLNWVVYSIWSAKFRYDPKYAPQYKSKHSNYVKLSN